MRERHTASPQPRSVRTGHRASRSRAVAADAAPLSRVANEILALQRVVGNRAVQRLMRAATETGGGRVDVIQRASYPGKGMHGRDVYETKEFNFGIEATQREKAYKAAVYVVPRNTDREATPNPISFISKDTGTIDPEMRQGWHRGHVVGLEIGGEDLAINIAPMRPGFNRGSTWRGFEKETKEAARQAGAGKYRMSVELHYDDDEDRIPASITVLREQDKAGTWTPESGDPKTFTHEADQTKRPKGREKQLLASAPRGRTLGYAATQMGADRGEDAQKALADGHMPKSRKAEWPDDSSDRPYENLDLHNLAWNLPGSHRIESRRDFSNEQRKLILKANMAKNGGVLKSDDPDDPHEYLDENGTADFPEIDHIIPKSAGGANAFSNARVVSWEVNNRTARVKSIVGLVDVKRLAPPALHAIQDGVSQVMIRTAKNKKLSAADVRLQMAQIFNIQTNLRQEKLIATELERLTAEGLLTKDSTVDPPTYAPAR